MEKARLGYTLHNACAATLSTFLREAGIEVPITLGAGRLASRLGGTGRLSRHLHHVPVGQQRPGEVGVTFDKTRPQGADHIYLAVECVDPDEMVIADNQAPKPHTRFASGKGRKTRTEYFLRAGAVSAETHQHPFLDPSDLRSYPHEDEDTDSLEEPFDDDGAPMQSGSSRKWND